MLSFWCFVSQHLVTCGLFLRTDMMMSTLVCWFEVVVCSWKFDSTPRYVSQNQTDALCFHLKAHRGFFAMNLWFSFSHPNLGKLLYHHDLKALDASPLAWRARHEGSGMGWHLFVGIWVGDCFNIFKTGWRLWPPTRANNPGRGHGGQGMRLDGRRSSPPEAFWNWDTHTAVIPLTWFVFLR